MASSPDSPPGSAGKELRAEAAEWKPAEAPRKDGSVRPIRTLHRQGRSDVLSQLDKIPFTPSQGVCTPSPTNMAGMWGVPHAHVFSQAAWGLVQGAAYVGSPSSGGSDTSMMQHSVPGSPGYGSWGGFAAPMPFSPTALQIAAASGALGSNPGTPSAGGRAFLAGSPGPLSPGQMMFARYFGTDGGSSNMSRSPPESSGSGDDADASDNISSSGSGSGQLEVSEAAHQIASAMCAAQQLPGEPPQPLLELASLLHAYGLVSAVPSFAPAAAPAGPPLSPDSKRQQARQRQKTAPKLNSDGSVRLNARQRRTLRRAQERAMKALMEALPRAHGFSSEQAAAHLASMGGMAGMLLGSSPPPAAAMAHHGSPVQLGPSFMGGPLSPGGMMAPDSYGALLASMQQQAVTVSMLQQAGYVDPAAAAWGMPQGLDMTGVPMPLQQGFTTPPRRTRQAHRTTPVGGAQRMSRFAPADAPVAAF